MSRFIVAPRRRKNNLKVKQEKEANFIHRFIDYKKKAKQNDRFPRVLVESSTNFFVPIISNEPQEEPEETPKEKPPSTLRRFPERIRRRFGYEKKVEFFSGGHVLVYCHFKKPTFCDHCSKLLLECSNGVDLLYSNAANRLGYRCKRCKKEMHESCSKEIENCHGSPIGTYAFIPQSTSNCDFSCLPSESQVDSVYEVIRQSMDMRSKKDQLEDEQPSSSNENTKPTARKCIKHQHSEPLPTSEVAFEGLRRSVSIDESLATLPKPEADPPSDTSELLCRKSSQVPLLKQGEESSSVDSESSSKKQKKKLKKQNSVIASDPYYVALHNFKKKEKGDLSLRAGNKLKIIDSKDENWWMGEIENKTGFVPSNYVMKLHKNEDVYMCLKSTSMKNPNNKEIQLKKNQIIAVKNDWPVEKEDLLYARCSSMEGYIQKEDLSLL